VRHYIDKLLEEVDEAGAGALRAAEAEVTHREGSLKAMRAEVSARVLREVSSGARCFALCPAATFLEF
jgi:hypothetical protein